MNGSARGKLGPVGIGGIRRNDQGNILAMFVASVGVKDSNEAEFMAIIFALEISL